MTNKNTKRALLTSMMSLLLCFTMLLGTTYAWFTDSVSSANNVITAGNLDIELDYWDGDSWETVQGTNSLFTSDLWEPGHTEVVYLKLSNRGTLALKYQFSINVLSETVGTNVAGERFKLSNYIQMGVKEGVNGQSGAYANREAAIESVKNASGIIGNGYLSNGTMLAGANELYMAVVVYLPETVGNEANAKTVADAPSINLGIDLFATQFAYESDSFDSNYDKVAPIVSAPILRPDSAVVLKGDQNVMIALSDDVIDNLPAEITEIGMSVSEPVVDATAKTITFATIELVDQNREVIDLEALNLDEKITITLPAQNVFAVGETVVLYHDGEYVATAVVNADTTISYEVEHLCEVSVGAVEVPEADDNGIVEISTAAQLFGFAQAVNAGTTYEGKTVVLTADIDLKNAAWTPIGSATADHGFMGNFDGNGKTISNLSIQNIKLDADGFAYAGLFGVTEGTADAENVIKDLTIKNVTINTTGHIVSAAIAYPYYTTVENITVCGDIAINGGDYTAGVLAYTRRCVNASNITLNGNDGSYIKGATTVGGVLSDIQMNGGLKANYSNFSASNVTITGNKCVGGISGIIGGQTLNGATVKNVTLVCSDAHVGIVSGAFDTKPVINNVNHSNVTGATAVVGAPYGDGGTNSIVIIDGEECVGNLATLSDKLAKGETTIKLGCDINGDLTIVQQPGVQITINGMGNKLNGVITVDGKSGTYLTAGLVIKNVTFAAESISADACIRLGDGSKATRYTCNVTVENCTFDVPGAVGVKSYTGGDKNLTITGCTATAKAHSLVQAKGIDGILVENCEVYSKNGLNFNNSTNVTVDNCTVDVQGYAVRFGESNGGVGDAEIYTIKNSTLKSAANNGEDAVIVLRGTADNSTLTITKTTLDGVQKIIDTATNTTVTIDGVAAVANGESLKAALAAGKDVIFANNITLEATKGGYNKAGIVVNKGQIVDGNGYTLKVTNAGATWDCAIYLTNGTIKNITVAGAMRGVFTAGQSADLYLDNVTFKDVIYTFNSDGGSKDYTIYISNCAMNGWTSHSDVHNKVVYTNCEFGKGSGYAFCRPYGPTEFVGCSFAEGYAIDARGTITLENCTLNGVAVTAENVATLVTGNTANATVK